MTSLLDRAARAYHDSTRQFRYVRDCLKPSAPPIARPVPFVEWDDLDDETRSERKKQVRAVLTAIREPSEELAATLACALADTTSPDGYADVSGANQEQGAKMAVWMRERGFTMVKYPRDMIDAALSEKPE